MSDERPMFMRIAWGRVRPGHWDAYEAAFTEGLAEESVPGLAARYLIQDVTQPDQGFSITLWESQEALAAYEGADVRKGRLDRIREHFSGDFNTQRCRVKYARRFG
jgi:heme-degrading monooxygenase HmoA